MSYTTPAAWTYSANLEATYNWKSDEWSIPLGLSVSKVTRVGKQLISVAGGPRYYVESSENGAEGWAMRFSVTLLFPK